MPLLWDDILNGPVVILAPHHEVHEGDSFMASYKSPEGTDINDNANLDIVMIPARGTNLHLTFDAAAGADAELFIYEGPSTTEGTTIATYNENRASSKISNLYIKHSPAVTATGTLLANVFLPGGTKNQASGGAVRQGTELILAALTKYLFRLTNRGGSGKPMGWAFSWYEEEA